MCVSKKLVGGLVKFISDNKHLVALQRPPDNDNIIKALNPETQPEVKEIVSFDRESNYRNKINLKLKSRLFVPKGQAVKSGAHHNLSEYVRCNTCNATLLQEIAVQNYNESIILPLYEPLDKEAIVSQYSEIIKQIKDSISKEMGKNQEKLLNIHVDNDGPYKPKELKMTHDFAMFLDKEIQKASRQQDNNMKFMIQNFKMKLNIQVQSMQVSHKMDPSKFNNSVDEVISISNPYPEDKIEELKSNEKKKLDYFQNIIKEGRIILGILKQAEDKYQSRVRQKF